MNVYAIKSLHASAGAKKNKKLQFQFYYIIGFKHHLIKKK